MKKFAGLLLGSYLVFGGLGVAAQDMTSPPKVLSIYREFVKPGKSGMPHEKAESAFVQAMTRAKWPTHYLTVTSLSGKPRALFLTRYDSFEAWEKDALATQKNEALSAALDRAAVADGDLLSDVGFEPSDRRPSSQPERALENKELGRLLRRAIAGLPEPLRVAVVLHDIEGLQQKEIAALLNCPIGTVKSRIQRGRCELRLKLLPFVEVDR